MATQKKTMSLEQFIAGGREVADLREHEDETSYYVSDWQDHAQKGVIFEWGAVVEIQDDGRFYVILCNSEFTLDTLEETATILYRWLVDENLIEEPSTGGAR